VFYVRARFCVFVCACVCVIHTPPPDDTKLSTPDEDEEKNDTDSKSIGRTSVRLHESGRMVIVTLDEYLDHLTSENKLHEALSHATAHNYIARIKAIVALGGDVDERFADGTTILMKAIQLGFEELAMLLVDLGADVHVASTMRGRTALMLACNKGSEELVRHLIEKGGAQVSTKDCLARNALAHAANHDRQDLAECLIDSLEPAGLRVRECMSLGAIRGRGKLTKTKTTAFILHVGTGVERVLKRDVGALAMLHAEVLQAML